MRSLSGSVAGLPLTALELIPDPAWALLPGDDRVQGNRAWCELIGSESLTQTEWRARVHPDDAQYLLPMGTYWGDRDRNDVDLRIRTAGGRYRWFQSRSRRHGTGADRTWIGTLVDIDEQRLAQEREALLVAANDAFARFDDPDELIDALLAILVPQHADYAIVDLFAPDGRFERFAFAGPERLREVLRRNRDAYAADGVPRGSSWDAARSGNVVFVPAGEIPEDWPAATRAAYHELGVFSAVVVPLVDGTGRLGALSLARTDPSRDGFARSSVAFYADIAARTARALQRTRTARELQRSERLYRTLADALPQIVGVSDAQGRVVFLNQRSADYTGVPLEQRDDEQRWQPFIHPDDVDQLQREWAEAVRTGRRLETMYRMRGADGVYRWFLNQAVPVRDDGGTIVSWIGTATDVDAHYRRESALRLAVSAGELFGSTLDTGTALRQLAVLAARQLADWCGVYVYDAQNRLRPVAIAHRDPNRVRGLFDYFERYPIDETSALVRVAQTGIAERTGPILPHMYEVIADPEQRARVQALGLYAVMHVPLMIGNERFGAFSLGVSETQRLFDDDDQDLATMLAQRAAIALNNARLFERQREVARTLQSAFLPASLPAPAGLSLDATYVPGARDIAIGGDWYDAETRDDGSLALSIGDVAGHGLDSAIPMGKMRQTFRVLGAIDDDPARVNARADDVLRREHPEVFVTAFLAFVEPATGELRYSNAGHPPPVVRALDGTQRRLDAPGLPLGLASLAPPQKRTERLADGELLVAFTDGLIEIERDIVEGERQLADVLAHPALRICSTPASLLRTLLVRVEPRDDIAIITVRRGSGPEWSFRASDERAARAARGAFVERLRAWKIFESLHFAYELVLGELIGNAVRYAPGIIDIGVERTADGLVIRALDRGPGFEWRSRRPEDDSENGRGLYLIEAFSRFVRCDHLVGFGTYLEIEL